LFNQLIKRNKNAGEYTVLAENKAFSDRDPDTRQRIMQAAIHLFAERGFRGVSVKDISTAAGTNTALLFYYFKSKKDLYDAIYRDAQQNILMMLEKALEEKTDAVSRLVALIHFFSKECQKDSDFDLLLSREIHGFGEYTREQLLEIFNSAIAPMENIVSQGIREGVFRELNPRLSAILIMGILHIFSSHNFSQESELAPGETFLQVREMILKGLQKDSKQ